uniref:Uncharacterized protein n=1 Tax=Arundo donax TaxID=35708 RepID=A0A0A8YE99_ARUDO
MLQQAINYMHEFEGDVLT